MCCKSGGENNSHYFMNLDRNCVAIAGKLSTLLLFSIVDGDVLAVVRMAGEDLSLETEWLSQNDGYKNVSDRDYCGMKLLGSTAICHGNRPESGACSMYKNI